MGPSFPPARKAEGGLAQRTKDKADAGHPENKRGASPGDPAPLGDFLPHKTGTWQAAGFPDAALQRGSASPLREDSLRGDGRRPACSPCPPARWLWASVPPPVLTPQDSFKGLCSGA